MLRETRQGTVPAYTNACSKAAAGRSFDRELIEHLLALAIPRRDTKAKARALIPRFGGIGPLC